MASPINDSYTGASGVTIAGGRSVGSSSLPHNAILDLIAAAPELSWLQVNTNTYESVWAPVDLRAPFGSGVGPPDAVINAWSSFAWDSIHHRLILWGGGHANYAGNEVYTWSAVTWQWELAYHTADVLPLGGTYITADGWQNSAMSSHTYKNQTYLPIQDKFLTMGGAAHNSGALFAVIEDVGGSPSVIRPVGAYTLDMAQAGQGKVGGSTGSNSKRGGYAEVNLSGANAWKPRDWYLDHPSINSLAASVSRLGGTSAYAVENGHDVIYQAASNGSGGGHGLTRFEFVNNDYHNDIITTLGIPWNAPGGENTGAYDPAHQVFVCAIAASGTPFFGWDLKTGGPNNKNFNVVNAGLTGPGTAEYISLNVSTPFAIEYDAVRQRFVAWSKGGKAFSITVPAGNPTPVTGWVVTKLLDPTTNRPQTGAEMGSQNDTGIYGKWRYAPDLDAFVALQRTRDGNIWILKPENWLDPRTP
jgi:hypothetical protein